MNRKGILTWEKEGEMRKEMKEKSKRSEQVLTRSQQRPLWWRLCTRLTASSAPQALLSLRKKLIRKRPQGPAKRVIFVRKMIVRKFDVVLATQRQNIFWSQKSGLGVSVTFSHPWLYVCFYVAFNRIYRIIVQSVQCALHMRSSPRADITPKSLYSWKDLARKTTQGVSFGISDAVQYLRENENVAKDAKWSDIWPWVLTN